MTANMMAFVANWRGSVAATARAAGISRKTAHKYMKNPLITDALAHREKALAEEGGREVGRELAKLGITRSGVLEQLAYLAQLDHKETGGNIAGQVRACAELAEILHMKITLNANVDPDFLGRSPEDIEYYIKHDKFPDGTRPKSLAQNGAGEAGPGSSRPN